jgi:uncharacterized membrane protein YkvA (DUF1232 family)
MNGSSTKLSELTAEVAARIEALSPEVDCAEFARQLGEARPDLLEQLPEELRAPAAEALSRCLIGVIGEIPSIVEAMLAAIDRRSTAPAVRAALAGALAYLVRPRDLLPDDLPGGFGFVDDCMILRATVSEFIDTLPRGFTSVEKERRLLELLAICVPPSRLPEFQAEVEGIWLIFHLLLWEDEDRAEDLARRIADHPLEAELPRSGRDTIPLPPEPRLSLAPGSEILEADGAGFVVRFSGGAVWVAADGRITAWE